MDGIKAMAEQNNGTTITLKPLTFKEAIIELAEIHKKKSMVKRIEEYEPGATQAQVLKALKEVAKAKSSQRRD